MDNLENIKRLEEANLTLITDYLEDNYVIQHNTFVNKRTGETEWGYKIIEHLEIILSIKTNYINDIVKCWYLSKKASLERWDNSLRHVYLKTTYEPDKQIELERLIGINAEKQMVFLMTESIAREIDSQILRDLKKKVTGLVEFENLMKCLGYKLSDVIYRRQPFRQPYKAFYSTTEYDKIYEQQNNSYWKDWFRARGQNEET